MILFCVHDLKKRQRYFGIANFVLGGTLNVNRVINRLHAMAKWIEVQRRVAYFLKDYSD